MKTASIVELKSRLSSYLAAVKRGEEVIIREHNRPIARLVPLLAEVDNDAEEQALISAGVINPPRRRRLPASFWQEARPHLSEARAAQAVRDERDED